MENSPLSSVLEELSDNLWEFVDLKDVLNMSITSQESAGVKISSKTIEDFLERNPSIANIGNFHLNFSNDLTIGMLRRVLNRLNNGTEALVSVDEKTGRVVLDIGSAFNDKDAFLAADVETVSDAGSEAGIFKQLEIISYDEYDDFNPRHPVPKDKAHRRGNSYFNSDIEMVVGELGAQSTPTSAGFDLTSIANAAMTGDTSSPVGGGGKAVKNKFLAAKMKKQQQLDNYHVRASAALNADSDEDKPK